MGKTHLLCDVAKQRIMDGVPTVLLMGQRFTGADDPWSQALRQLDLSASAEQFVGALEAAAQIANRRALVIIDAINESADRKLWPSHLATFLARLKRSPWIGIVLSVRSAYLENLIPENVRDGAVIVEHRGFADHEYDAGRTFFSHYGLEFSSVPIMHPEFRNPLFLKTLCAGLQGEGLRTIPRGFEGITAIFERYLLAVNRRLATACDYDRTRNLVSKAMNKIARHLIDNEERRLMKSVVQTTVDELLPGRGFEHSLYRGLIVEGVLIEHLAAPTDAEEVVSISYERLADHIIGDLLLRTHLKAEMPEAAFREGGGLAFLCDEERYVSPGLIEAFCIQIPERVGKELVRLAPTLTDHWHIGDAFRQSIVWRKPDAFSDQTQAVMNELIRNEGDYVDTLDALLTVASANDHPFNAEFLDRWLRRDFMPDRDAQWSIYLRYLWKDQSAVDRLIDWASSLSSTDNIDSRSVELCSIALDWMLSSPHRFLRDRATKALVSLLTGRPHAAARLVERFFDVDDLYVVERVYAVAYGVAMRSSDPAAVGSLAARVYEKAFASGKPPIHILARDYARGIIERAIHLGSELALNEQLIRPPYQSAWPKIPNEDEIQPLLRSRNTQSPNDGDPHGEWAKNRIGYSVMTWDFARYVIGTNSWSPNWLSLRLDEDPWCSPDKRIEALLPTLSKPERSAWETYSKAGDAVRSLRSLSLLKLLEESSAGPDDVESEPAAVTAHELEQAEQVRDEALGALLSVLTPDHRTEIESILRARDERVSAPRFDLKLIQRYVLSRVFDLGWTTDRFGEHDHSVSHADRGYASKSERIGKKYQWIAYHEILAYIADHYQYRPDLSQEDSDRTYEGPWQESLRNIDPSSTLPATPGGTSFEGHTSSWWTQCSYSAWDRGVSHSEWVSRNNDIPDTKDLLIVMHPEETGRWLIADGDFFWREDTPTNVEPTEVALRELSLSYSGHFIRKNDLSAFKKWAQGVDFYGHWMPDTPGSYNLFLGEYGWSPAFAYLQRQDEDGDDWITPERNCPVSIRSAAYQYHSESGDFDCSVDRSYTLQLPHHEFIETLKLKWAGSGAHYLDQHGKRAAFDPTAYEDGPTALLLREDLVKEYLADKELVFCWIVVGGKRVIGPARGREYHGEQRISGAIYYTEHGLEDLLSSKYIAPPK